MKNPPNQKGFAPIAILFSIVLISGIILGVYLVNQRTQFLPFASENGLNTLSSPVGPLDSDGDLWNDAQEIYIGTDPFSSCSKNKNKDAWPPDLNNNKVVNVEDYNSLKKAVESRQYSKRFDLTADGKLDSDDVLTLKKYIGQKCKIAKKVKDDKNNGSGQGKGNDSGN